MAISLSKKWKHGLLDFFILKDNGHDYMFWVKARYENTFNLIFMCKEYIYSECAHFCACSLTGCVSFRSENNI